MNGYEYKDQPFSVEIAEALIPERWSTGNRNRVKPGTMLLKLREHPTIIERTGLKNQYKHVILCILQAVRFCCQKG